MPVQVLGPPLKPTRHNSPFRSEWGWLRQHCVAVYPLWEKGSTRVYNLARPTRFASVTLGAGGTWADSQWGPGLHFADAGYIDTGVPRIGSVGLFAASTERWTAVIRAKHSAVEGFLLAKSGATNANANFQILHQRNLAAARTPRFIIRGTITDSSWGLDDGLYHTYWVTWDGSTAIAYYDDAQGALTLGVGTAVEETTQNIMMGARSQASPAGFADGDFDFMAILDVELQAGRIRQWQRDLYAPWRPYRRRYGPPVAVSAPGTGIDRVYRPQRGLAIDRLELWSDLKQHTGKRLGTIAQFKDLQETVSLDGEHTIEFSVAMDHPIVRLVETDTDFPNLRVNQVVRMVKTDGTVTSHRISKPARRNQRGARSRTITAKSIINDLTLRGLVSRTTADGVSTTDFEALALSGETHLREFILPALDEAGAPYFDVGTLAHSLPVDMVYQGYTPQAAFRQLVTAMSNAAGGNLEVSCTETDTLFLLNILTQVGAGQTPLKVRARRDLIDLTFEEDANGQATRVACQGAAFMDVRPHVGKARWNESGRSTVPGGFYDIRLADPAGGDGPIRISGQFLPPAINVDDPDTDQTETPPRFHLRWLTGANYIAPIVATDAATQTFRIQSSTAPPTPPASGYHSVQIVADADGRENLWIDHPTMVEQYGVRVATLDRPDIPATDNLVPNSLLRDWPSTSPMPTGWDALLGTTLTASRETDSRLWQHGGQALRIRWVQAGNIEQVVATPLALIPLNAQGYLSFFLSATTLVGAIRVSLVVRRDSSGPPLVPGSTGPSAYRYVVPYDARVEAGDLILPDVVSIQNNTPEDIGIAAAWDLSKFPLYGGSAQIAIAAARDAPANTECVITAAQITVSPEQMPLLEGNGGVRLHQAANARVGLYGTPAPILSVNMLHLASEEGYDFPFDQQLRLGRHIQVADPDSDLELVDTRVVGWTRQWDNRLVPNLQLSNDRPDITALLAGRARHPRHTTRLIPGRKQALTYEP